MKKLICLLATVLLFAFGMSACLPTAPVDETQRPPNETEKEEMLFYFTVGNTRLNATNEDNAATAALKEKLQSAPITIHMADYGGWEKVGSFGFDLPTADEQITAQPCDFVLYQGNQLVIFYGANSWRYTRLGKITGVSPAELKHILGDGDVTITLAISA